LDPTATAGAGADALGVVATGAQLIAPIDVRASAKENPQLDRAKYFIVVAEGEIRLSEPAEMYYSKLPSERRLFQGVTRVSVE